MKRRTQCMYVFSVRIRMCLRRKASRIWSNNCVFDSIGSPILCSAAVPSQGETSWPFSPRSREALAFFRRDPCDGHVRRPRSASVPQGWPTLKALLVVCTYVQYSRLSLAVKYHVYSTRQSFVLGG